MGRVDDPVANVNWLRCGIEELQKLVVACLLMVPLVAVVVSVVVRRAPNHIMCTAPATKLTARLIDHRPSGVRAWRWPHSHSPTA